MHSQTQSYTHKNTLKHTKNNYTNLQKPTKRYIKAKRHEDSQSYTQTEIHSQNYTQKNKHPHTQKYAHNKTPTKT